MRRAVRRDPHLGGRPGGCHSSRARSLDVPWTGLPPYAARPRFGRPLVNSALTLALVTGLTVPDTSEHAAANLAWGDIRLPKPVFVDDTLWAESEILDKRESRTNPHVGIVTMRCRGINQRREVVIEFTRAFMVYRRGAPEATELFPGADEPWRAEGP